MPDYASRKFIDLIFQTSSKWADWDPPVPIKVGSFGKIDRPTGVFIADGNIYDEAFQESFKQQGLMIDLSHPSCQPIMGAVEEDMIMSSMDVKKSEILITPKLRPSTSFKAEFQFQEGKRGAVLVMRKPQQEYIPQGRVLSIIHEAHQLKDKYIVSSIFTCPGYYLYLSNRSAERVTLVLTDNTSLTTPIDVSTGGEASIDWWTDAQAAFLRKAFDKAGQYRYTPLFDLKRRQHWFKRKFRGQRYNQQKIICGLNVHHHGILLMKTEKKISCTMNDEDSFSRRSAAEGRCSFV